MIRRARSTALTAKCRSVSHLYSSYYKGSLSPAQLHVPQAQTSFESRSFSIPLSTIATLEQRGDAFLEAGIGHAAVHHLSVCVKGYLHHYSRPHNKISASRVKLASAFRLAGCFETSNALARESLNETSQLATYNLETICEALCEVGFAEIALGHDIGVESLELCARTVLLRHDLGSIHRVFRSMPRFAKQFSLNQERQFVYASPGSVDRIYATACTALDEATNHLVSKQRFESAARLSQLSQELNDTMFINSRQFAGRILRWRGHNSRRFKLVTSSPTTSELLAWTPTVHQPVKDYRLMCTSPLESADVPSTGVNCKLLDDGNPLRRVLQIESEKIRRKSVKDYFLQQKNFV